MRHGPSAVLLCCCLHTAFQAPTKAAESWQSVDGASDSGSGFQCAQPRLEKGGVRKRVPAVALRVA